MNTNRLPSLEPIETTRALLQELANAFAAYTQHTATDSLETTPFGASAVGITLHNSSFSAGNMEKAVEMLGKRWPTLEAMIQCATSGAPRPELDLRTWLNQMWDISMMLCSGIISPLQMNHLMIKRHVEDAEEDGCSPDELGFGMAADLWPVLKVNERWKRCGKCAEETKDWMRQFGIPVFFADLLMPHPVPLGFVLDEITPEFREKFWGSYQVPLDMVEDVDPPFVVIAKVPGVTIQEFEEIRRQNS